MVQFHSAAQQWTKMLTRNIILLNQTFKPNECTEAGNLFNNAKQNALLMNWAQISRLSIIDLYCSDWIEDHVAMDVMLALPHV